MINPLASIKQFPKVGKLYLYSKFFEALYFAWPIWNGFATQTITLAQVGIFFSVLNALQLVAEIPTGVVADKFGRKSSAILGSFINLFAPLIIYFSTSFALYLVAAFFYAAGRAFLSGSLESLIYDHKDISKAIFRKINELSVNAVQAGLVISTVLGGILYSVDQSLPFLLEAAAGIICIVLIALIDESYERNLNTEVESHTKYFVNGVKNLFSTKFLRVFLIMGIPYAAMLSVCIQFVNENAMIEYGVVPAMRGILMGGANILALFTFNFFLLKVVNTDVRRVFFMAFGGLIVFSLFIVKSIPVFILVYLVWNCLSMTQTPFFAPILHANISSSYRSTAMSTFYTLKNIAILFVSALIGFIIEHYKTPRAAYLSFTLISLFLIVPCALWIIKYFRGNRLN